MNVSIHEFMLELMRQMWRKQSRPYHMCSDAREAIMYAKCLINSDFVCLIHCVAQRRRIELCCHCNGYDDDDIYETVSYDTRVV